VFCGASCARQGDASSEAEADRHSTIHRPSGRVWARREWGVLLIKFYETALGDSRAEATLISAEIVPLRGGGRAIEICGRGIPQRYWSERPVAGKAAEW
jgi:hypothetical protein